VAALLRMVRWHDQEGEPDVALGYAQAAAGTDPLREDLQRLLMRQYRRAGLPELAVHHYESCRLLLAAELGVEPLPETREAGLGRDAGVAGSPLPTASRAVREVLQELESTREELRTITEHVEHSITALRGQLTGPPARP
jgi:DNA-binding SARP family transcriptional activator